MAVITISANPTFVKEFNNVLSLDNLVSYLLISDKDTIPIPSDYDGSNPVYTGASAVFKVLQANEVKSTEWVISEFSTSNCSISVSDSTKTVTVTAITSDTASFTIKATKTGKNSLYKKVTVFKVKDGQDGADGSGTPDNVTIITDGSGNLKVEHNDVYNDSGFTNGLNIGFGSMSNRYTTSTPNSGVIRLSSTGASYVENSTAVTIIGDNDLLARLGSGAATFTNGVVCGHGVSLQSSYDSPFTTTNFAVLGVGTSSVSDIRDNSVIVGCNPRGTIDGTVILSLPQISPGFAPSDQGNRQIVFKNQTAQVSASTPTNINLNINTLPKFVKFNVDIFGFDAADTGSDWLIQNHTLIAIDGGTIVNNYDASTLVPVGIFTSETPTGVTCSFSDPSHIFTIAIPSLSKATKWYITYQIQISL